MFEPEEFASEMEAIVLSAGVAETTMSGDRPHSALGDLTPAEFGALARSVGLPSLRTPAGKPET